MSVLDRSNIKVSFRCFVVVDVQVFAMPSWRSWAAPPRGPAGTSLTSVAGNDHVAARGHLQSDERSCCTLHGETWVAGLLAA